MATNRESEPDKPTPAQLAALGAVLHRYMSTVYGPDDFTRGNEFAVWGNYGSDEQPLRRLVLDGAVVITKAESELLDALGYNDSFGNVHE